jgi:hypothetical protein
MRIYFRRPRRAAVVLCGDLGHRAVPISRCKARRTNSDNLNFFASCFVKQALLDLSGQLERYRHAAFRQLRSGHVNIEFSCSVRFALTRSAAVGDKESTAITITLPRALDRALQAFADQKHCGNKSAAIREVLYKEAGMQATLRMDETKDTDAVVRAERRSVKYGSRKRKGKK